MSIKSKSLTTSRYIAIFMALVTIGFGLSVIIGWHAHITPLIRYQADTIAMVYSTALCFVVSGIAALALTHHLVPISIVAVLSSMVLVVGMLGLSQHIFDINLGIDQLFFDHYETTATGYPGRMAPNTALNFILIAISLLLVASSPFRSRKFCLVISESLGILVLMLSTIFVSGYFSSLQKAYEWTYVTPMALNTAIGFVLLSISVIALSWYKGSSINVNMMKMLPFILSLCIFIATLLLAQAISQQEILNNYMSNIPSITFMVGTVLAILIGALLYFAQKASHAAKKAKYSLSLVRATLESTADGIVVIDTEGNIVDYNKRFLKMWRITGEKIKDFDEKKFFDFVISKLSNKKNITLKIKQLINNTAKESFDELKLKNGPIFEQYVKPQLLDGVVIGQVWSYRDITLQKLLEEQLLHQATYDKLTGLPNRALLVDLMNRTLENAKHEYKHIAILLIDVDRFTQFNDVFGRSKGDELLQDIAARLKKNTPSANILGRIGGDEFLVISQSLRRTEDILPLIHHYLKALEEPFNFYDHNISVTCCIGTSFYPKDGQDLDVLLSNADVALLRAKQQGRNNFQFYTQDMNVYSLQRLELENQLYEAIEKKQFFLHYQPIFRLDTLKPTGVEALIRWQHPEKGVINPFDFIPLAEETGTITQIGEWVLKTACTQAVFWIKEGLDRLKVAVNISAHQFKYGMLDRMIPDILSQTGLKPENLELELTESILIEGSDEAINTINTLQNMGITVALDDFGTGYSSLSYLRQFRLNKLKIDHTFIDGAMQNPEDLAIIQTVIAIAKSLGMKAIAEGIETEDQLKLLIDLGCDYGQGYYLAHPLPTVECTKFLKQHKKNSYKRAAAAKVSS